MLRFFLETTFSGFNILVKFTAPRALITPLRPPPLDATTTVARAPRVAEFFAKLGPKIARTTSTAGHQNRLKKIARPTGGPELESRLYGP